MAVSKTEDFKPVVGEIVFHQTGEVMKYTDVDAFKKAVNRELDYNTSISIFLANGMDKSWIFDNVSGIGLQEVSYKSFSSFEYLSKELASLDSEKTMFEVYLDHSGEKKLHYLGYFYESDEGLKLQEYTGFEVPFSEVVNEGIYDYEQGHSEEFGGQQYITYYDGKETADAFQEINEYFVGETLTFLCKDHQFMDLPVGKYALSIHSLKELCDIHNKNNKFIDKVYVRALDEDDGPQVEELDEMSEFVVEPMLDCEDYAFGLFKGDVLVGYCTIGCADVLDDDPMVANCPGYSCDSLLLSDVFIKPEEQGQGYAAFLVNEAVKMRTENEKELVFLTLLDDGLSHLYEKCGFEVVGPGIMVRDERVKTLEAVLADAIQTCEEVSNSTLGKESIDYEKE